jgi:hypothetical protein
MDIGMACEVCEEVYYPGVFLCISRLIVGCAGNEDHSLQLLYGMVALTAHDLDSAVVSQQKPFAHLRAAFATASRARGGP